MPTYDSAAADVNDGEKIHEYDPQMYILSPAKLLQEDLSRLLAKLDAQQPEQWNLEANSP